MSKLNTELVHKIALAMATSEGWMLKEIDETNKHCQRYIQMATIAVEVMQNEEEAEWQEKPWELEVSGLKAQQKLWNNPPFTEDDGEYPECLLPQEF